MKFIPWRAIVILLISVSGLYIGYVIQNYFHDRANVDEPKSESTVVSLPENQGLPRDLNADPYVLDLTGQSITELPEFVLVQKSITHLILTNNRLTSLTSEVGEFTKLRELDLTNNNLQGALPAEIRLMKLVDIRASNNQLTAIPAEIGQISSLTYADFSNNNIDTIPNEILNLEPHLEWLDLSGNPFEQAVIDELRLAMPSTIINF